MAAAIDANRASFVENAAFGVRNATQGPFAGKGGRLDCGGALQFARPHCEPFRAVLDHPALVPAFHDLVGSGYRLDHQPLCFIQRGGAEGFDLHGGARGPDGSYKCSSLFAGTQFLCFRLLCFRVKMSF